MSKIEFHLTDKIWETLESRKICLVHAFTGGKFFCLVLKLKNSQQICDFTLQTLENNETFFFAAVFRGQKELEVAKFGFCSSGYLRYRRQITNFETSKRIETVTFWFSKRKAPDNWFSWATTSCFGCHGLNPKHKIISLVTDKSDCNFALVHSQTGEEFLLHKFIFLRNCKEFFSAFSNFEEGNEASRVFLPDLENLNKKTVEYFINFLYFGTFSQEIALYDISAYEYLQLYLLGDYFKIESLKQAEAHAFYQLLDGKFAPKDRQEPSEQLALVCELVEIAALYDFHPQLQEIIFTYFAVFVLSLQETEAWLSFKTSFYDKLLITKPHLIQKINRFCFKNPIFSWKIQQEG